MRVVIGCNAVISAARLGTACGKVIVEAVRRHEIVLPAPILNKYRLAARRPKIDRRRFDVPPP